MPIYIGSEGVVLAQGDRYRLNFYYDDYLNFRRGQIRGNFVAEIYHELLPKNWIPG